MTRTLLAGVAVVTIGVGLAAAQTADGPASDMQGPAAPPSPGAGGGFRSDHITSTGATVPNPGASQSAGTTSLDRGIQARDNQIDSSICKGC